MDEKPTDNTTEEPVKAPTGGGGGRRRICVQTSSIHQAEEGWRALCETNGQQDRDGHYIVTPRFFRRGRAVVRMDLIDGVKEAFDTVDADMLAVHGLAAAFWFKSVGDGDKKEDKAWEPHPAIWKKMLRMPLSGIPLPAFDGFIRTPVFGKGGELHSRPGFNGRSRLFLRPSVRIPEVPREPTGEQVQAAREKLVGAEGPLWDFPYTNRCSDLAHVLAAALQQFVRPIIDGPTPLFLIDKPAPGVGASTLAKTIARIATGEGIPPGSVAIGAEDEFRKRITAEFRKNPSVILFDNIGKPLTADLLAIALSEPIWGDRILGRSDSLDMPIRVLWLGTGNNPKMSDQILRRTIRIRLDPMGAKLQNRQFVHEQFDMWMEDHLAEFVWAGLVLCQHWVREGMPMAAAQHKGYPRWSAVMGGVLGAAGVEGFLTNLETMHTHLDEDSGAMLVFIRAWWEIWGGKGITTRTLLELHERIDSEVELEKGKDPLLSLRGVLRECLEKHFGPWRVEKGGLVDNTATWRLVFCPELVGEDGVVETIRVDGASEGMEAEDGEDGDG